MSLWQTRSDSLNHLEQRHPSRLAVLARTFELFDSCVDAYEGAPTETKYARVCGLTLLKAKNLAAGAYGLTLDGLGQESGALLRPMIEYCELLTYFRLRPEMIENAEENDLPKAGERAKVIDSIYKQFREHLNENASHSSFSEASISHLLEPSTLRFKKTQRMVPHVLERNLRDLVVQLHMLLHEAILTLKPANEGAFLELAERYEALKQRMFDVYELNRDA